VIDEQSALNVKIKLEERLLSTPGNKQATISVVAIEDPKCSKCSPEASALQVI
jgi:hypothetical protein